MDIREAATRFVDYVLDSGRWTSAGDVSESDFIIMMTILIKAGFDVRDVVIGRLLGSYRDQDGSFTGETYPLNSLSPFKVIAKDQADHCFATGWLDCAFRRIHFGSRRKDEKREFLIEVISKEIERSIPLKPILISAEGDVLSEYPPSLNGFGLRYFVDHTRDINELSLCVGIHKHCNGWMDRHRATDVMDAISCRQCHLRVLFPREISTYGELRKFIKSKLAEVPA